MLKIILAQNRQRAVKGLKQLFDYIQILENSKVQYEMTQIKEYKDQIIISNKTLEKDSLKMGEIDDILTFISVTNEIILNKFNN